jgi:hypothetical protein
MQETNSGLVYTFGQLTEPSAMRGEMADSFRQYRNFFATYDPRQVDMTLFESYSARVVTGRLAEMLNQIVPL